MAMNFWLAQERAKKNTRILVVAFIALTLAVAAIGEYILRLFFENYAYTDFPYAAFFFVLITFIVAVINYSIYQSKGGSYVAEALGARLVNPRSSEPRERQLLNIVEEMSIATSLPIPEVYILQTDQINAFAAGTTPENACVCVTTGALSKLSRDELQGVIGHEFGHIYNHDSKLSMRLAAMLMGFFFIFYIALRMLQFSAYQRGERRANPILLVALIMVGSGILSYFAGTILSSMVSREREYLADASSVQFTRNPEGLVSALKKIEKETNVAKMPVAGMAYNHLYFDHRTFTNLFATHPPIQKRIEAILGHTYAMSDE